MKNTQVIQLMSIVRLSIFMLGITMMSCNSKKEQQLPAIGKSVALFDYFSYKGNNLIGACLQFQRFSPLSW